MARPLDRNQRRKGSEPEVFAALSLGSAHTVCVIVRRDPEVAAGLSLLGAACVQTRGVKAGVVTDLEGAERSVRLAVEQAERQAETRINAVTLVVSGGGLQSRQMTAEVDLGGQAADTGHARKALEAARTSLQDPSRRLMHCTPLHYVLDGQPGVQDPRGLFGQKLGITVVGVSGHEASLRNLMQAVTSTDLAVETVVAAPYATAHGVLVRADLSAGVLVVDMGAGLTGLALFDRGGLAFLDTLPVAAGHITSDLAKGLHTNAAIAEKIKLDHADLLCSQEAASRPVEIARLGEDGRVEAGRTSLGMIAACCGPRLEETFSMALRRLKAAGIGRHAVQRVVLSGGGAQLKGVRELAEDILRLPVRVSAERLLPNLCEPHQSGFYAAAVGALRLRAAGQLSALAGDHPEIAGGAESGAESSWRRAFRWVKDNV
jgi:cell division protein FtsA